MKLSDETLNVLKNFASINQSIFFKKGKVLRTVSARKNIMAEAVLTEEIPTDFGVYDLNNFLSVISLHRDDPTFDFEDNNVLISGLQGRSKIRYRFCSPKMIVMPPEKRLVMPDPEINVELTAEDFDWIMRTANVLASPYIAFESDGSKVFVTTLDLQQDSAHTESLEIGEGNGNKYRMLFKTENIKLMPGGYDVIIASKGISYFKHKTSKIEYWITTEAGSKYEKAN